MIRRPPRSTLFPYTDALPISSVGLAMQDYKAEPSYGSSRVEPPPRRVGRLLRSEEHTSELQSHLNLVCRLLLEKKKRNPRRLSQCAPHHRESRPRRPATDRGP